MPRPIDKDSFAREHEFDLPPSSKEYLRIKFNILQGDTAIRSFVLSNLTKVPYVGDKMAYNGYCYKIFKVTPKFGALIEDSEYDKIDYEVDLV